MKYLVALSFVLAASIGTGPVQAFHLDVASTSVPVQAYRSLQWDMKFIHAYKAWTVATTQGAGVKVCDIDTGVSLTNPDFAGAIAGGIDLSDPTVSPSISDNEGHGTHVSGTILARGVNVYGVAPQANLLVAKVFDASGNSDAGKITGAIFWCVKNGAQVVNMSLGGPQQPYDGMADAISYACKRGVDFAIASGNDGSSAKVDPASVASPCLIAVNAGDRTGEITNFSNYNENKRTVTAPGQNIVSDSMDGLVQTDSGTSMAAPHVAGVMALLRGMGANAQEAVNVILSSTSGYPVIPNVKHLRQSDLRYFYGYGELDAYKAVKTWASLKTLPYKANDTTPRGR